jgi:hypothetical protein
MKLTKATFLSLLKLETAAQIFLVRFRQDWPVGFSAVAAGYN